jgi:hypothetical protein
MRGLGVVRQRRLRGFDSWVGEDALVTGLPGMALTLRRHLAAAAGRRVTLIRKACYFDGMINGRFEFLFRIEPDIAEEAEASPLVRALLQTPVAVPGLKGEGSNVALEKASPFAARLWALATTRRGDDPGLSKIRAGRAFAVLENDRNLGAIADAAPVGVKMILERSARPLELFLIHPRKDQDVSPGSEHRASARTVRTYLLRLLQDIEGLSQICDVGADLLDDQFVQTVFNEYTRHINRSVKLIGGAPQELIDYCYAAFARLYPGRIDGLRVQIVGSNIRPNVKSKLLDLLDRASKVSEQTIVSTFVQGDIVMGDKFENVTATGRGIAIGRGAKASADSTVNQTIDPAVIAGIKELAEKVRTSGNADAKVDSEMIATAAAKAEEGDEEGAVGYLKRAGKWALDLAVTAGSVALKGFLKAKLGIG